MAKLKFSGIQTLLIVRRRVTKLKDLGNENDSTVSLVDLFPLIRKPADVKSKVCKPATCSEDRVTFLA